MGRARELFDKNAESGCTDEDIGELFDLAVDAEAEVERLGAANESWHHRVEQARIDAEAQAARIQSLEAALRSQLDRHLLARAEQFNAPGTVDWQAVAFQIAKIADDALAGSEPARCERCGDSGIVAAPAHAPECKGECLTCPVPVPEPCPDCSAALDGAKGEA